MKRIQPSDEKKLKVEIGDVTRLSCEADDFLSLIIPNSPSLSAFIAVAIPSIIIVSPSTNP